MIKLLRLLFVGFCLLISNHAFAAHQLYADADGITIPYGTKLQLTMTENITTKAIAKGDIVNAYLSKDVYINNKLVLPSGTIFRGRISGIRMSAPLSRSAQLGIVFDNLVTKKGEQIAINSGLATDFDYVFKANGMLTTKINYFTAVARDTKKAGKIVPRTVKWGETSGNNLFVGAKYVFVPIAAIGGSCACVVSTTYSIIADLFKHGDEIVIKKNTNFDIILLSAADIP